jgi:hypothetical protein
MSGDPRFDELWMKATGRTTEDKALLNSLHNAEDLYNRLDTNSRRYGDFRNKHAKFFNIF